MVRRTVLSIGILCGASAAAAIAFASEMSRVGSYLVDGAVRRGRAVTDEPALGRSTDGDGRLVAAPDEAPPSEYCPFPRGRGASTATLVPADSLLGAPGGATRLALEGQSRIPDALPPALCAGDTTRTQLTPQLGKP